MFGINQISWLQFTRFILAAVFLWYLSVFLLAFIRQRSKNREMLFEDDQSAPFQSDGLKSISISSRDYPLELVPLHLVEDISLPVSFYEETGLEEGYPIDNFSNPNDPDLSKILEQIQFQQ